MISDQKATQEEVKSLCEQNGLHINDFTAECLSNWQRKCIRDEHGIIAFGGVSSLLRISDLRLDEEVENGTAEAWMFVRKLPALGVRHARPMLRAATEVLMTMPSVVAPVIMAYATTAKDRKFMITLGFVDNEGRMEYSP